jgi:MFS family permease
MQHSHEALDRPGGFSRVNLLAPLRHRDFRLLWTGMAVSLLGDGVFLVAMAWEAYVLWNAPAALSLVGIAMTGAMILFLIPGGIVSDRFDRRRAMLVADGVRAAAVAVLAALALGGVLRFWELVALVGLYGVGTALFTPAFDAIVPDLLPAGDLAAANSLDQFVRPIALRLAGPAAGGWLVAAGGAGTAFAFDAASFAASTAVLLAMRPTRLPRTHRAEPPARALADGVRFVRQRVWLWGTLLAAALAYLVFLGPVEVLLPYVVKNELHASAGALGFVFAAGGVGAVGAAFLMGQRGHPRRDVTFIYACWALATLAVAGYGLATASWQLMLASLVFNALETAGTIVWATLKQRNVPASMLGRVSSLDWLVSIGLLPISFALTAPVAAAFGVRTTLVAAAAIGAVITLGALVLPGMRDVEGGGERLDHRPQDNVHSLASHPRAEGRAYEAGGAVDEGRDDRHSIWALAVDPDDPELWYLSASTGPFTAHGPGEPQARVYRRHANEPWEALDGGVPEPLPAVPYALLASDGRLFAVAGLADGRLWESADCGETWAPCKVDGPALPAVLALASA